MKFLFLVLGLTLVLAYSVNADPKCHTSEVIECLDIAINWFQSLPKGTLPETEDQVNVMCEEIIKAIECAEKYRDSCMTPLQKEVVVLITEGISNLKTSFCAPGAALKEQYLKNAPCLSKVTQLDEVRNQIEYALAVVENLLHQENKNKIVYGCCGFRKIDNWFLAIGIKHCGQEGVDAIIDLAHEASAQFLDALCSNFDGSEPECQKLLPPYGTKPSEKAKSTGIYRFFESIAHHWLV